MMSHGLKYSTLRRMSRLVAGQQRSVPYRMHGFAGDVATMDGQTCAACLPSEHLPHECVTVIVTHGGEAKRQRSKIRAAGTTVS